MKEMPVKRIRLQHAANVRDLGGFETRAGETVKWNRLFRGDGLNGLADWEWKKLTDRGVRTVIDLRSRSETIDLPDCPPEGIQWVHCPLQEEELDMNDVSNSARRAFAGSLEEGYCQMAENHPQLLARAIQQVSEGLERGAVLFHCTAGKDRTGVLAAALLYLLGVEDQDIVADYQVSEGYNRYGIERMLRTQSGFEKMKHLLKSDAVSMDALLECFRRIDLETLLLNNGLIKERLDYFRLHMLENIM